MKNPRVYRIENLTKRLAHLSELLKENRPGSAKFAFFLETYEETRIEIEIQTAYMEQEV